MCHREEFFVGQKTGVDAPAFGAIRRDEKKKTVATKELLWLVKGLGRTERGVGEGMGYSPGKGFIPFGIPLNWWVSMDLIASGGTESFA